jgi:hypothetical protein
MEIHRSWSVSAVSLTIFTVVVFGLLAAVIVWSSKANAHQPTLHRRRRAF